MRAILTISIALALCTACGSSSSDTSQPVAAAQPGATTAGPQTLVLGQPPATVQVPVPPSFNLAITENAEYQIDVMGDPADAEVFLYNGDELVEQNDDGGQNVNARIVRFLTPATYSVRVVEHRARAMTARVQAQRLQPLASAGTLLPGASVAVAIPTPTPYARNDRDAAREVAFTVATAGNYACTATAAADRHARIQLIQNGAVLQQDDAANGQLTRQLTAGSYIIRVFDWSRRDAQITVACNPAT